MEKIQETTIQEKLVITRYRSCILTALVTQGKVEEIRLSDEEGEQQLGNIYVGRVKNIVPNIQAAFIEIENGLPCYYSLKENLNPIFTRKTNSPKLVAGDELLVQVSREKMKTKAPAVTSNLSFSGKYLVLTSGNTRVGLSGKLSEGQKSILKTYIAPYRCQEYGWIVRTNAREAGKEEICREALELISRYEKLKQFAEHRTCFSCVYQTPQEYLLQLRDTYTKHLVSIITDDKTLYESMHLYLEDSKSEDLQKLVFYQDPLLPLMKLYNLEGALQDALRERVWLKSGASLVIQPTEALTAIDVNTGKFESKKKSQEDTFLKINLEAAKEIARQLRLRNISGIIIVDFINLEVPLNREQLLKTFAGYLKQDPVKTVLVDMTGLDLAEVTRKKIRKSLAEQAAYLFQDKGKEVF